jgi:DNA-binding LacI/PurR family transcriptional regulator
MRPFVPQSTAAQVAAHLREEILRGDLRDTLPGYRLLAEKIGVNHKTLRTALGQLEDEGLLVPQGSGRPCRIHLQEDHAQKGFRVCILPYEDDDRRVAYHRDIMDRIERAGYAVGFAGTTLSKLQFDVKRVERYVRAHPADAWVVFAGTREILGWFANQTAPVFAVAGHLAGLPIAGATFRKSTSVAEATRRLVELGHRRIVMLVREDHRKPFPGVQQQAFLDNLESMGIQSGSYNLPDWVDTAEDFHRCLHSLFTTTPPTALLIDEATLFFAAQQSLAWRGVVAPRDVSLLCLDPNPGFSWCRPSISHINWQPQPLVSRIVRWTDNVARGKIDRRMTFIKTEFVEGGTIGPAPACQIPGKP